jgi:type IV pilus assembly protein PilM
VRELVDAGMMEAGAVTASVPKGWLAGVRGALKN